MPLPVLTKLLSLLLRMREVGPPLPIVLALKLRAPTTPLSDPRLTASSLAPRLLPTPRLLMLHLSVLGPAPDGLIVKVVADQYHRGVVG
jgi:hypothetical protein